MRRRAGVDTSLWWEFHPGQRVMTREGFPGRVTAVEDGAYAGQEHYIVELDGGLGGGQYGPSELSPLVTTMASKGWRDPYRQRRRWEQQADAWECPNGCGHRVEDHKEHPSTWERVGDDLVEVKHPRYRPGLFTCQVEGCGCEFDSGVTSQRDPEHPEQGLADVLETIGDGEVTHSGVVIKAVDSGRLLLTQRTPYEGDEEGVYGRWEFPGGKIGEDEDPVTSAIREFHEETGLTLPEGYYIDGAYRTGTYVAVVILVPNEAWTSDASLLMYETEGIGWFHPSVVEDDDVLTRVEMADADWTMIREALRGRLSKTASAPEDGQMAGRMASDDYPELAEVLAERPPLERAVSVSSYLASQVIAEREAAAEPCDSFEPDDEFGPGTCRNCLWAVGAHHPRAGGTSPVGDDAYWRSVHQGQRTVGLEVSARNPLQRVWDRTMDRIDEGLPESQRHEPGHGWSYDWCRFRRDSRCYYPKELDAEATKEAGYAVWVPVDRGMCPRQTWEQQEDCPVGEPGPNTNLPDARPDATVPWEAGGQRDGVPEHLVFGRLLPLYGAAQADPDFMFHFAAGWRDVQAKAARIRRDGLVRIISVNEPYVAAEVRGDTDLYRTTLLFEPGTRRVAMWECGCAWSAYSWGRSGRWKKYEGRMCSHALAVTYEMQSQEFAGGEATEQVETPEWRVTEPVAEHEKPPAAEWMKGEPRLVAASQEPREADHNPEDVSPAALMVRGMLGDGAEPNDVLRALSSLPEASSVMAEALRKHAFPAKIRGRVVEVVGLTGDGVLVDPGEEIKVPPWEVLYPSYDPVLGLDPRHRKNAMSVEATVGSPGVFIALVPPADILDRIVEAAGDASQREEMHITIAYLGKTDEVDLKALRTAVTTFARVSPQLRGRMGGWGVFHNPDSPEAERYVLWAAMDVPHLESWREGLIMHLEVEGLSPKRNHGFTPHMTVAYSSEPIVHLPWRSPPLDFFILDDVKLVFGGEWASHPLQGGPPLAVEGVLTLPEGTMGLGTLYDEGYGDQATDGKPSAGMIERLSDAPREDQVEYAYGVAQAYDQQTSEEWGDDHLNRANGALPDSPHWHQWGLPEDGVEAAESLGVWVSPDDDAMAFEGELKDEPEPALPETTSEDEDGEPEEPRRVVESSSIADLPRPTYLLDDLDRPEALRGGGGGDIAAAAKAALAKQGVKTFTPEEQAEIIGEGEGVTAGNLDLLDLEGTHYMALEDALRDEDDELGVVWD